MATFDDMHCYRTQEVGTFNIGIWAPGGSFLGSSLSLISMQLVIIIVLTQVLHFLLRPLKQPRVVAEMLAGIMIGPSGLGMNKSFRETFYPMRGQPALETLATFGMMYVIFLIGVKTDPSLIIRSGKKAVVIGLTGLFVPLAIVATTTKLSIKSLEHDINNNFGFVMAVCVFLAMSSFAVHVPILCELNLLNSDLGRIAMSACMTNDGIGWTMLAIFILGDASQVSKLTSFWAFISISLMVLFVIFVVRPLALWVIEKTPAGKPVEEGYIFIFLLLVLLIGFYSDLIGTNSLQGALILGLVIPDGPPLGTTLSEKIDTIASGLIIPLYYTATGLNTNIWHMECGKLHLIIFLGWLGKIVGVLLSSLFYKIPLRDTVALSLFMNSKGIVELVTYNYWMSNKDISTDSFSTLVLWAVIITAVSTPIASTLYNPARRYAVYKRRTLQYLRANTELRILACVQDQLHVPAMLNVLEASAPSIQSPICIYLLQLVELVGRAAPVFIPHKIDRSSMANGVTGFEADPVTNAFLMHEQKHGGLLSVYPFTTISPYASMHDEVCRMAVEKRVSLVIMHFHRRNEMTGQVKANSGLRNVNRKVISIAPCSVGVLIDRQANDVVAVSVSTEFMHHVVVLFFGGGDDREALAYGLRMAKHPGVGLTVIRFLPSRGIKDDQIERKMDSIIVDELKATATRNPNSVRYKEELVGDFESVAQVVRKMELQTFDLIMVGIRHSPWNKVIYEEGLSAMSECPELGIVGDFLATADFKTVFSVLVMKQQDQAGLQALLVDSNDADFAEQSTTRNH